MQILILFMFLLSHRVGLFNKHMWASFFFCANVIVTWCGPDEAQPCRPPVMTPRKARQEVADPANERPILAETGLIH